MEGYIPVRDRPAFKWIHADGRESPDWWEIGDEKWSERASAGGGIAHASVPPPRPGLPDPAPFLSLPHHTDEHGVPAPLHPLALIPPSAPLARGPAPRSPLTFFPNNLAYRPEDLLPPPSKWSADRPETLDALPGERVDVVALVRMPVPPEAARELREGEEDGEEVLREWGGVVLGVVSVGVTAAGGWEEERGKGRA
jgi:hypothetical protein